MKTVFLFSMLFFLGIVPSVHAEPPLQMPDPGNWRGSITAGLDSEIQSDLLDNGTWQYRSQSTVVSATSDKKSFDDIYGNTLTAGFEAAYAVTRFSEVFARLSYEQASGDTTTLGRVGTESLLASFDDYNSYGLDLGYRYFFDMENTGFTPYLGGVAGMRYVPGLGAQLNTASGQAGTLNLFDDSFTPNFGLDIGFLYPLSRDFAIGFETGLYYQMDLKDDDSSFVGGDSDINNDANRLYVPARIKGTI